VSVLNGNQCYSCGRVESVTAGGIGEIVNVHAMFMDVVER
jgi:hypothetical protein